MSQKYLDAYKLTRHNQSMMITENALTYRNDIGQIITGVHFQKNGSRYVLQAAFEFDHPVSDAFVNALHVRTSAQLRSVITSAGTVTALAGYTVPDALSVRVLTYDQWHEVTPIYF
jgi:hypothetical protein